MKEGATFTMKEMTRYQVIKSLLEGKMTNEIAAMALGLSRRQIQRVKKKVYQLGPLGIVHGNRGRPPPHAFSHEFRDRVVELVKTTYFDFNFSHLSEILEEQEGICINRETLRRWLRPMGLGGKVRKLPPHRKRRKRSSKEGERLFLDGSPHLWFGEEASTLILCTDDATGKPLYGLFQKEEDLDGCFRVCLEVFQKYGLPALFYLDRASQFTTTRHGGVHVTQNDQEPTQFERAMEEMGIALIFAHSPEARGRGERINGTFQDRLVSELRLKGIDHAQEATKYLNQQFIPRYHQRFGVEPEDKTSAWRALSPEVDIRNVLCSRFQRTVKNDNTISVNKQVIQLLETHHRLHFVKAKVQVNLWTDGSWHVFHPREGELPCVLIAETSQLKEAHPVRSFRGLKIGKRSSASQLRLHRQENRTTTLSDLGRY